jgi:Zn-dependent peptidase ImmA (M78 family)
MIDVSEAMRIASDNFPWGPEALASHLGIDVQRNPIGRLDGWCMSNGTSAIIQINSNSPAVRQRFTLAHELAHLILGTSPDILFDRFNFQSPVRRESEKAANSIASELLLPGKHLERLIWQMPVDIVSIKSAARQAGVSEIVVSRRVADHCEELGLIDACFLEFSEQKYKSNWSKTLRITASVAERLYQGAMQTSPSPYREECKNDEMFIALIIEGTIQDSYLLVQLALTDKGVSKSKGELLRDFEDLIFRNDPRFRSQLQGCFGAFKPIASQMRLEEAVAAFYARYSERWTGSRLEKMISDQGKEYVKVRLNDFCGPTQ